MVTNTPIRLSSTLRGAGAGEVLDQVTCNITAFVKEKQITGKAFLRLTEGDLEGYVFFFSFVLLFLCFVFISISANNWIESKVRTTNNSPHPPPLRLSPCVKTSYEAGYGCSSRAVVFPSILHKMTISRPTLRTLMWGGGVGTSASILLPMAMGELKA